MGPVCEVRGDPRRVESMSGQFDRSTQEDRDVVAVNMLQTRIAVDIDYIQIKRVMHRKGFKRDAHFITQMAPGAAHQSEPRPGIICHRP